MVEKYIQFINVIDWQQRFRRLEAQLIPTKLSAENMQIDSHHMSYMDERRMREKAGEIMGFNKSFCPYMLKYYGYLPGIRRSDNIDYTN